YQRTQYEVYDYPGRFKGAHGQNFARWQMDGWRNNAEVARGTSRSPEIWPGRRIVLTGHPQANLNREWQVGEESAQHLQQSLRLPGQQYDEESGLYYNRNRYYDPLQGRYITQDPIGLRGEWNLYKYPLNPVRFIDSLGLKFHVNGDPSDFNQAVEYLKQDSQMKETIDFLSSSEETINIEYIEGTNVRFNSNNMAIYWNSRASLFCSTELNSKSQSPALGLGHEFAHAQYYLLDKENFMALLSRTDKKYENKEEARVITIIESRAAKTLGECTRGAHSGLPFYRVDGPLQTMKITGTPE
ncbi:TPA: RHS repeat-associated core domain-containing protein, partial [Escherichia coli]